METPEQIPQDVQAILDTYDDNEDEYAEHKRIVDELEAIGWTYDYYLDAVGYNLRPIQENNEEE